MIILSLIRLYSYRAATSPVNLRQLKILTVVLAIFSIGYSSYSLLYHLPIEYWPNALAQLQMQNPEPAFKFGFQAILDSLFIVHETKDLTAWGGIGFLIWYTGYFSICGWIVLFLMTGPRKLNTAKNLNFSYNLDRFD